MKNKKNQKQEQEKNKTNSYIEFVCDYKKTKHTDNLQENDLLFIKNVILLLYYLIWENNKIDEMSWKEKSSFVTYYIGNAFNDELTFLIIYLFFREHCSNSDFELFEQKCFEYNFYLDYELTKPEQEINKFRSEFSVKSVIELNCLKLKVKKFELHDILRINITKDLPIIAAKNILETI